MRNPYIFNFVPSSCQITLSFLIFFQKHQPSSYHYDSYEYFLKVIFFLSDQASILLSLTVLQLLSFQFICLFSQSVSNLCLLLYLHILFYLKLMA